MNNYLNYRILYFNEDHIKGDNMNYDNIIVNLTQNIIKEVLQNIRKEEK